MIDSSVHKPMGTGQRILRAAAVVAVDLARNAGTGAGRERRDGRSERARVLKYATKRATSTR